ncbi:alpha/beta hydrolase-fold protein [Tenacibaculum caenipelagi]|uniref:Uncharacterized protein n=1 Tax=Tenacibaculum caenipelagi TaxID=1325435 RepID=A0A4R6TD00_9FLAO|nr:alpha/beta hydrolase-fold protein [Tenacibaculum caenipelagi]TDQ25579.1 hypothetical protein DFQ07_2004 [Tenacibaculum caenipelagi]
MNFIKSLVLVIVLCCFSCSNAQQKERLTIQKPHVENNNSIILASKVKLYSKRLGEERELLISLPENYDQEIQNYPVIFVMDADHVAMFELTRSINNLLAETDFMPKSIIVGLTNNGNLNNRFQMTSGANRGSGFYENKASDYLHFLQHVVIPYVKMNYRVANHKTIIGLSPSNGPLHEAFYNQPNIFDSYIFLAADLYFNYSKSQSKGEKLMEAMKDKSHPKATVYLGMGSKDVDFNQKWGTQFSEYEAQLTAAKNENIRFKFDIIEGDGHYEMAVKGIKNAFKHIYSEDIWNRQNIYHVDRGNTPIDIKKHFDRLSAHYGFDIFPPESKIESQTRALLRWGSSENLKTASTLLTQAIEYYPNSASLHLILAEAYQKSNDTNMAKRYLKKAIELANKFTVKNYHWFSKKVTELNE